MMSSQLEGGDRDAKESRSSETAVASESRVDELRESLAQVESRVERACAASARDRRSVTLIVVTKFFPACDVLADRKSTRLNSSHPV